jgi:hypothetical protein
MWPAFHGGEATKLQLLKAGPEASQREARLGSERGRALHGIELAVAGVPEEQLRFELGGELVLAALASDLDREGETVAAPDAVDDGLARLELVGTKDLLPGRRLAFGT